MNRRILKKTSSELLLIFGTEGLGCRNYIKYHAILHLNPIASKIRPFCISNALTWNNCASIKRNFVLYNKKADCIKEPMETDKSNDTLNLFIAEKILSKELDNLENGEHNNSLKVLEGINELTGISVGVRVASANKIFSKMRCDGVSITKSHYLSLLKCYVKSKYFGDVQKFLSDMKSDGVELDEEIKVLIIKCLSEAGLGKQISEMVELGEEEKFSPENKEYFLSSMLYSYGISGNLTGALEKFHKLKEEGFKARSSIYTSLMRVIAVKGDKTMLDDLYKEVSENEINFSHDEISSILCDLAANENFHLLQTVKLLSPGEDLMKIASEVLIQLVHQNQIASAFSLVDNLLQLKYDESTFDSTRHCKNMYKLLIETLVNLNHPAVDLLEKCKELRKSKNLFSAFECLLYSYLKNNDMAKSLMTFRVMFNENVHIQPHYFWPLLISAYKKYGDDGIIEVLRTMSEIKVFIDEQTLTDYVFPNVSTSNCISDILERIKFPFLQLQYIKEVFMIYALDNCLFKEVLEFVKKNPLADGIDFTYLKKLYKEYLSNNPNEKYICGILKELEADPAEILEHLMWMNDTGKIETFLRNAKENKWYSKDKKKAAAIFQEMRKLHGGLDISELKNSFLNNSAYRNFRDDDAERRQKSSNAFSSKYEYMKKLELAEMNFFELKARNMTFLPHGLRMIKLYVWELLYDRAIRIRNEIYEAYGFQFELTPRMMAHFARMAAYENDVEAAMDFFEKMQSLPRENRLNLPSSIHLARLLIQHHHFDEVCRVLQAMPKFLGRTFSDKGLHILNLLQGIAYFGDIEKVQKVTDLLLSKNCVFVSRNIAHIFIQTYIKANDLENAVKVYFEKGCISTKFPSSIPLFKALLKEKRFDLFDEIMETQKFERFHMADRVAGLIIIAMTGDEDTLTKYSERFKINMNNELLDGLRMEVDTTACKTIIQVAIKKSQPYDLFVSRAISHIYKAMDYDEVEKFIDFCEHFKIKLDSDTLTNLLNFAELGKIRKSSFIDVER